MPDRIGLEAVLDMVQWNKGVTKYGKDVGGMGKGTKRFSETLKKASKVMLGTGLALGGAALALGKMAAPLEGIGDAFEVMSEKAGLSLDALREASGGTVADFELMRQSNIALTGAGEKLGKEFGQKLPRLMEIARASARATGQSAEFMFESLVTGVKRSSPMLIDNTGLQIKMGEANKKLADQLGKTVAELSAEEKQIALLNATMEAGEEMVREFGGGQRTAQEEVEALGASLQNARDQIGLAFVPTIGKATAAVGSLVEGFMNLSPTVQQTIAQFAAAGSAILLLGGGILAIIPKIQAAVGVMQQLGLTSAAALGPIGLVVAALVALGAVIAIAKKVEQAHKDEAAAIAASSTSYEDYVKQIDAAKLGTHKLTKDLYKLVKAEKKAGQELAAMNFEKARDEVRKMVDKSSVLVFSLEDLKEKLLDATASADDSTLAFMSSADAMYDFFIFSGQSVEVSRELSEALSEEAQHLLTVGKLTEYADLMGSRYRDTQKAAAGATDELTLAEEKAYAAMKGASYYAEKRTDDLEDYAEKAKDAEKATEEFAKAQREAAKAAKALQEAVSSTVAEGLIGLREFDKQASESAGDYETRMEELRGNLANVSSNIKLNFEASLPDKTTISQRMQMAGDAWDEFALRAQDVMANGIASPWIAELERIGGAKPPDVGFKEWAADLEAAFYEGDFLGAINENTEAWQENASKMKEAQAGATAAYNTEVGKRKEAINSEIEALKVARAAQLAEEKAARGRAKLEMALSILEQTGQLKAWAEQRFKGPDIDMSHLFDEADKLLLQLDAGRVDIDDVLGGMIMDTQSGIDDMLVSTAGGVAANRAELEELTSGTWITDLQKNMQSAIDPQEYMPPKPFDPIKNDFQAAAKVIIADGEKTGKSLIDNLDTKPTKAVEAFSKVMVAENEIWQEKTTDWTDLLLEITDPVIPDLQTAFETMSTYVLEQLAEMIRVTDLWRDALQYITDITLPALQAMFAKVAAAIIKNLRDMIAMVDEFRKALEKLINKTFPAFVKAGVDAFDAVAEAAQGLIDKITGEDGVLDAIASMVTDMDNASTDMVADIQSAIDAVNDLAQAFGNAIGKKTYLEDHGPDAMDDFAESVYNVGNAARFVEDSLQGAIMALPSITMPQVSMPAMAGAGTTNNYSMPMTFNTTINSGLDQALFEGRVRQTVRDAMRGN